MVYRRYAIASLLTVAAWLSSLAELHAQTTISGTTYNKAGTMVLGNVKVEAYCTNTGAWLNTTTSDPALGTFSFPVTFGTCSSVYLTFTRQGASTWELEITQVPSNANPLGHCPIPLTTDPQQIKQYPQTFGSP